MPKTTVLQDAQALLRRVKEDETNPHTVHIRRNLQAVVELAEEQEQGIDRPVNTNDSDLQNRVQELETENTQLKQEVERLNSEDAVKNTPPTPETAKQTTVPKQSGKDNAPGAAKAQK